MTNTPQPRLGLPLTWISAKRSRGHDIATAGPHAGASRFAWLAHPAWAGIGVIISTMLALAGLWLALTT